MGSFREGEVGEDGLGAGFVEGEVAFALIEEGAEEGLVGDLGGNDEEWGEGGGGRVEAVIAGFGGGEGGGGVG